MDPNKPDLGDPVMKSGKRELHGVLSMEIQQMKPMNYIKAGWAGRDALDSIAFELKMRGFKDLALKIQSVFDDEKNESSMRLNSMLPEGKHKKT